MEEDSLNHFVEILARFQDELSSKMLFLYSISVMRNSNDVVQWPNAVWCSTISPSEDGATIMDGFCDGC